MRGKKDARPVYRIYTGRVLRQTSRWRLSTREGYIFHPGERDLAIRFSEENKRIAREAAEPKDATDDVRYFGGQPQWSELDRLALNSWAGADPPSQEASVEEKLFWVRSFYLRQALIGLGRNGGFPYHPFPGKTIMVARELYSTPVTMFFGTRFDVDLHPMPKWCAGQDVVLWYLGTLGVLSGSHRFQAWCRNQIAEYQRQHPWRWAGICAVLMTWDVLFRVWAGE